MERFDSSSGEKPCRACVSVEDMMRRGRELAQKKASSGSTTDKQASTSTPSGTSVSHEAQPHRCDCPVDKDELGMFLLKHPRFLDSGRSTWNLLHTMSVYYPEKPSEEQKQTAKGFLTSLGQTYPCDFCAADLRKDLAEEPPKLSSRSEFADWMCRLHNKVNEKTGKPVFDCSKVFERWKDGWKDGSCDF